MPLLALDLNPANKLGYKRILVKTDRDARGAWRAYYKYRNAHSAMLDESSWYNTQVCFLSQVEVE